jgi:hypothetical protein
VGQLVDRDVGGSLAVVTLGALEVEEAVVVEVADDQLGEAAFAVGEVGQL